jgi:hypothetical protein
MKGQVQVYRNLNETLEDGTKVYSVRNDKNKVVDHVTEIALSRPVFRVGPKGNQRVRDESRKNVHAYIQGRRMRESLMDDPTTGIRSDEWVKITYDPYQHWCETISQRKANQRLCARRGWLSFARMEFGPFCQC